MKKIILPLETTDFEKVFGNMSKILKSNKEVVITIKGEERIGMSDIAFGMLGIAVVSKDLKYNIKWK